ncbi:MAG: YidB family protein [Ramlibacter sp.]
MANDFLSEILGKVLGGRDSEPPPAGAGTGGLGGSLGNVLGGNRGTLLAMLLPLAMQWVQSNGGIGAVLQRFRQKGYDQQANSWMSTGPNEALPPHAVGEVVGMDELSRLSQQLGVSHEDVASGMAEILPEVANQLTPGGEIAHDANDRLSGGMAGLDDLLRQFGASQRR